MSSVHVPHQASSVAQVRRRLVAELALRGLPTMAVEDAAVLVSELVGNAVLHGRPLAEGGLRVTWQVDGEHVTLRVSDGGDSGTPAPRRAGPHDTGGRGLAIVAGLAGEWGVDRRPGTTTVWAHVPLERAETNGVRSRSYA